VAFFFEGTSQFRRKHVLMSPMEMYKPGTTVWEEARSSLHLEDTSG
jgi:hypothetical protein